MMFYLSAQKLAHFIFSFVLQREKERSEPKRESYTVLLQDCYAGEGAREIIPEAQQRDFHRGVFRDYVAMQTTNSRGVSFSTSSQILRSYSTPPRDHVQIPAVFLDKLPKFSLYECQLDICPIFTTLGCIGARPGLYPFPL